MRLCTTALLPGLSTHRAIVCRLMLAPGFLVAPDAKRGRLCFRRAEDSKLEAASGVAALALWWSAVARLTQDHALQLYWGMVEGILPSARPTYHLSPVVAKKLLGRAECDGGVCSDTLASWWKARKDEAMAKATDHSSKELAG